MNQQLSDFVKWISVHSGVLGGFALIHPDLYENTAYDFAQSILPIWVIGLMWLVVGVLAVLSILADEAGEDAFHLTVIVVSMYTALTLLFAWSIFTLTWKGAHGAIAGAMAWGGWAWFGWRALVTGFPR